MAGTQAATASEVAVRTGEHPGFTRLVVDDPDIRSWSLGRSGHDYELRVLPGGRSFALSGAFRQISRRRLATLAVAPNGDLKLGLGCDCHVQPVEIRPGVIVLDIYDGPAPAGARYEHPLPEEGQPSLAQVRPRGRPATAEARYDWRKIETPAAAPKLSMEPAVVTAMRQSLVEQLSRGAAAGAVDFVREPPPADPEAPPDPVGNIQILPEPGIDIAAEERPDGSLMASVAECPSDERFDVASWRAEGPVADQMGHALSGLTGEFDDPQPTALERAVRFYLSVGFGAEARQLLAAFPLDMPDRDLWDAMARVLDGERQPAGPLSSMANCDTAAALWSALADPPPTRREVNAPAVLRAFSALPPDLRQLLGPRLVEDFLNRKDDASAQSVNQAMLRGGDAPTAGATLSSARLSIARGEALSAADLARVGRQTGPDGADALALLVEQKVIDRKVPTTEDVLALAALYNENEGTDLGRRLGHAYRLALAATGDYEQAFSRRDLAPDADIEVWSVLADMGPDSALLEYAVLPDPGSAPDLPQPPRQILADRLRTLGLEGPANLWVQREPDAGSDARTENAPQGTDQKVAAASGSDPSAVDQVSTARDASGSAEADAQAAKVPAVAGLPQEGLSDPEGTLARSRALVEESAKARQRIEDLLRSAGP
ncbi:hypothetical protein [Rhodobacter sp. NSM]|uniref:hypothetical protein n=1 Tax=Rhodobacter sp. NSM TaxID=3457501 RepID=UPI003FD56525